VRTLARAATLSLMMLGTGLTLVVLAVAAIGILGTRASTALGNSIASDELTTAVTTAQLARDMDQAYATGERALLTSSPAQRSRLLGQLYTGTLPAVDAELSSFEQLHEDDPPAEYADVQEFTRQWFTVRDLLNPANVTSRSAAALAAQLAAAYQPLSAHLDRLFLKEAHDGDQDRADAS
jgi:hypothetical protein